MIDSCCPTKLSPSRNLTLFPQFYSSYYTGETRQKKRRSCLATLSAPTIHMTLSWSFEVPKAGRWPCGWAQELRIWCLQRGARNPFSLGHPIFTGSIASLCSTLSILELRALAVLLWVGCCSGAQCQVSHTSSWTTYFKLLINGCDTCHSFKVLACNSLILRVNDNKRACGKGFLKPTKPPIYLFIVTSLCVEWCVFTPKNIINCTHSLLQSQNLVAVSNLKMKIEWIGYNNKSQS